MPKGKIDPNCKPGCNSGVDINYCKCVLNKQKLIMMAQSNNRFNWEETFIWSRFSKYWQPEVLTGI